MAIMDQEPDAMDEQEPQEGGDESERISALEDRVSAIEAKLGIGANAKPAMPPMKAGQMIGARGKGGFFGDGQ